MWMGRCGKLLQLSLYDLAEFPFIVSPFAVMTEETE